MKITKLSLAAIAAMTLTTGAMADIVSNVKLDGQVKYWYETWDKADHDLFNKESASGDAALTVGATADMGPIKVGSKVYAVSSMGLENTLTSTAPYGNRTERPINDGTDAWIGELHGTGTIGKTTIKAGRQALNTPFAFTENWNVVPNTFDAIVVINKDIENFTLVGASVLRGNSAGNFKVATDGKFSTLNANMIATHAKVGSVPVNAYYYDVNDIKRMGASDISAYWIDASLPVGPAKLTAIYAGAQSQGANSQNDITAFALKGAGKFNGVSLLGAYSQVSEPDAGGLAIANVGTGFKKTKLPTAGVYTDGLYVAQPGSKAFKVKAATKLAGFGVAAQYINNTNDITASKETSEIDLIVSKKFGAAAVKAIFLNRSFEDSGTDKSTGGNHVRIITSYNF